MYIPLEFHWFNEADETFRLPVKVKGASGSAVVGNGMTLGLTDGTKNAGLIAGMSASATALKVSEAGYGGLLGSASNTTQLTENQRLGITTDSTKSGIETSTDGLTLYFYVGEVLQSANLINAGRALEKLSKLQAYKMGIPDWDAQVVINFPYTAPTSGFVLIHFYTDRDQACFVINGKNVIQFNTGVSGVETSSFIPINAGDVLSITDSPSGLLESYFYPCKEVN